MDIGFVCLSLFDCFLWGLCWALRLSVCLFLCWGTYVWHCICLLFVGLMLGIGFVYLSVICGTYVGHWVCLFFVGIMLGIGFVCLLVR